MALGELCGNISWYWMYRRLGGVEGWVLGLRLVIESLDVPL